MIKHKHTWVAVTDAAKIAAAAKQAYLPLSEVGGLEQCGCSAQRIDITSRKGKGIGEVK